MAAGVVAFIIGMVLWALNLTGYGFKWGRDWPLLVAFFGIYTLVSHIRRERKRKPSDVKLILKELEEGKITAEEALRKMKKGGEK